MADKKIDFLINDFFRLRPFKIDCLALCPPWGGMDYLENDTFDLYTDLQLNLENIMK